MEVASRQPVWRKSLRSIDCNACVEVGAWDGRIGLRDSKDAAGGAIYFSQEAWQQFIASVKLGEFDFQRS